VVHPVVEGVEFAPNLAVFGELAGDRFPQEAAAMVDVEAAAQGAEERPVLEGFVAVVGAVHAGPFLSPDQGAVGAGVAFLEERHGGVDGVDQVALG
jgi:hypothetical protein